MNDEELVEKAEQVTEDFFGSNTWVTQENGDLVFSEEAQDFFCELMEFFEKNKKEVSDE